MRGLANGRLDRVGPWLLALLFALLCLLAAACGGANEEPAGSEPVHGHVTIRNQRVSVELARSPAEQARGLGYRDSLSWGHGMLFLYDEPGFPGFWMRGMRFSIDIVWIRDDRIVDISAHVPFEPGGNGPRVRPRQLTNRVLEVPAGYAAVQGWRVGDRVLVELDP